MAMDDFGSHKSVHMIRWPRIRDGLEKLLAADHYGGLFQRDQISEDIKRTAQLTREWLSPVVDLTAFPYCYHVNGTHNSIERWLASETRPIYVLTGEYPYAQSLRPDIHVVSDSDQIPQGAVAYISNPFSSTGNYDPRYHQIRVPVILDLAYVGTTAPHCFAITPNTEQVFWSGSKTFGLGCFRTGYRFTKTRDPMQDILANVGYANWLSVHTLAMALRTYGPFDTHQLVAEIYDKIIRDNDLLSSHSYLLGLGQDVARYGVFAREDGQLRVPVGRVLDLRVQQLDMR